MLLKACIKAKLISGIDCGNDIQAIRTKQWE